jgi:hypothetical protein
VEKPREVYLQDSFRLITAGSLPLTKEATPPALQTYGSELLTYNLRSALEAGSSERRDSFFEMFARGGFYRERPTVSASQPRHEREASALRFGAVA